MTGMAPETIVLPNTGVQTKPSALKDVARQES